jgi:heat shock protein 1/8
MEKFNGCIGIDLGTTFSCVGVWIDDHVEIISNDMGNRTTPSWIAFKGNDKLVGELAKQQAHSNPRNTIYDIKRIMGLLFNDPKLHNDDNHQYAYKIVPDSNDRPMIEIEIVNDDNIILKRFKPEELSAMILRKMADIAESHLGKKVTDAVITVPAYFNDAQRTATKNSAQIAGLNCVRIINEPTAACLCYGLHNKKNCNVLIFDLGGGTFDVSVLELSDGVFEVKATSGDTHLGGEDFDNRLVKYLLTQFKQKHGIEVSSTDDRALRKLKDAAETAKKRLSQVHSVCVDIDSLVSGIDFSCKITRSTFESVCDDLFLACLDPVKKVLQDAELLIEDIDEIVLVGGSTRIPKIQKLLSDYFGGKTLNKSVNPDEAVAYGAAIQGAILSNSDKSGKTKDMLLVDVIPLSLGIETTGGIMASIVPRNSSIPCEKKSMFSTIEDDQHTVLVQIFEGERKFTTDNHKLGTFELVGIPKAIKGAPKIEVVFKIDANGILDVTACEKTSNISQKVTITKESGRLSKEEIDKMISDSETFRAVDEIKKDSLEALQEFEKYLKMSQGTINDTQYSSLLTIDEKSSANQLILDTFEWLYETPSNSPSSSPSLNIGKTKQEITDCKNSVEYYLKPIINKVYARKISDVKQQSHDESHQTSQHINQILNEYYGNDVNPEKQIKRKITLKRTMNASRV